jgi:hypothetical protein
VISADVKALVELIENALITAPEGASIRSISEGLVSGDYAEIIAAYRDEWILEHLDRLVAHGKAQRAADQWSKQIPLPGFERMPVKLVFAKGRKIPPQPMLSANYKDLRRYLADLRKRQANSPRIAQVKTLLELIEKWRKRLRLKNAQGLTVAEVMEREAGML